MPSPRSKRTTAIRPSGPRPFSVVTKSANAVPPCPLFSETLAHKWPDGPHGIFRNREPSSPVPQKIGDPVSSAGSRSSYSRKAHPAGAGWVETRSIEHGTIISLGDCRGWRADDLRRHRRNVLARRLIATDVDRDGVVAREYFGPRIMGTLFGAATMVSSLGMAFGPWAGGMIFDTFHDYRWLYTGSLSVGLGAMAVALAFPALPSRSRA